MKLNNSSLYVKGTADMWAHDVKTGDLIGYTNKIDSSKLSTSCNAGEIRAGIGAPVVINIPDSSAFKGEVTAADFSLEARQLATGGTLRYNGTVPFRENIVAKDSKLVVSRKPVSAYGESVDNEYYSCYVGNDGKNYGVPFDNGAVVACYRTDLLEQAGLTIDDFTDITFDQYLENGKKVLEATGKPLISMQAGECDLIMMMLQSAGASLFNDDGTANIVNNETLKIVMETYKSLKDAGVLTEVNSWDEYVGDFVSGNVAGTINGCWIMASIQTAEDHPLWCVQIANVLCQIPAKLSAMEIAAVSCFFRIFFITVIIDLCQLVTTI